MKKTITILVSALLLVALVACGGGSGDPAVGSYQFSAVASGGIQMDLAALGVDTSAWKLAINEDGTFTMEVGDLSGTTTEAQTASGTWEKDGDNYTLTVNGEAINGTYDSGAKTFAMDAEGTQVIFKK